MAARAVTGFVYGRVQGVYYRASFQREASGLGLAGWVRNLPDGRVAFHVQGDAGAVQQMLDWAGRGPTAARVDRLELCDVEADPALTSFQIDY